MGWSLHHPVGLLYHSPMFSYKGYTLVSSNTADFAVLVDMEGRVCHRWEYHGGIAYGKLLLNGNLLIRTSPDPDYEQTRGLGGGSASLVELDWDGVKVWEYNDPALHHDYQRLLNGNTIYLRWEPMPADLSVRARGGHRTPEDPINMLGDTIREVSPDGETVAEWRTWQNLSVEEDVICPLEGRREWDARQRAVQHQRRRFPGELSSDGHGGHILARDGRSDLEMGAPARSATSTTRHNCPAATS